MSTSSASPLPEFSLRDIVAEICDTHRDPDPAKLVEPVLAAIDAMDYQEALRQALHGYITTFVVTARHTPRAYSESTTAGRKIGKSRLAGVAAFLSSREFSPARGEWIHLFEATADDLRSMAAKREAMAMQYMEKAAWYASIAETLKSHSVDTVGHLPVVVQEGLLAARPA